MHHVRAWKKLSGVLLLRIPPVVTDFGQTRGGILIKWPERHSSLSKKSLRFIRIPPLVTDLGQTRGVFLKRGVFLIIIPLMMLQTLWSASPEQYLPMQQILHDTS